VRGHGSALPTEACRWPNPAKYHVSKRFNYKIEKEARIVQHPILCNRFQALKQTGKPMKVHNFLELAAGLSAALYVSLIRSKTSGKNTHQHG
jgi:hypothetical protein